MSENSAYSDLRSDFFKRWFDAGLTYEKYLASGTDSQRENWSRYEKIISLSSQQQNLLAGFKRQMNLLVLSGIWCGDCARQGPMLAAIASCSPQIVLRFVESKANPELQEELRINGATKVPVVVTLSEDFFELSRFGDKHLSAYREKAGTGNGPTCDAGILPPADSALCAEVSEWIAHFERLQLMLVLAPMLRKRYGD